MRKLLKPALSFAALSVLVLACEKGDDIWDTMIPETDQQPTTTQIQGYVFRPALVDATEENVRQHKVPAGFTVNKFAEGLGKPRMLLVSPAGHVYATDREAGTVTMLRDTNGDGVADQRSVVATSNKCTTWPCREARCTWSP